MNYKSIYIVGPTGVGKSDLAINLALKLDTEVINTDSRLFYKGLDIGTSKPTKLDQVKVNHRLIDFLNPEDEFSLFEFLAKCKQAMLDLKSNELLPILVGGSGQYFKAIVENWDVSEVPPDKKLRNKLSKLIGDIGVEEFYKKLVKTYPQNALNIDSKNPRRLIRAFELGVYGVVKSQSKKNYQNDYNVFGITMDRKILYEAVDKRIDSMVQNGWIDEVKELVNDGVDNLNHSFTSIGYSEIYSYILGTIDLPEALLLIKKKTRNLIRHQYNWFKLSDPNIKWFDKSSSDINIIAENIIGELNGN